VGPRDLGPDFDFGASPVLVTPADGHDVLPAGQKSGILFALDPDQGGRKLWENPPRCRLGAWRHPVGPGGE
jgi:polyvinyl alcohol dehydrogenase (cytochrome)